MLAFCCFFCQLRAGAQLRSTNAAEQDLGPELAGMVKSPGETRLDEAEDVSQEAGRLLWIATLVFCSCQLISRRPESGQCFAVEGFFDCSANCADHRRKPKGDRPSAKNRVQSHPGKKEIKIPAAA